MYWLLEACIFKYRYIHELIYAVFGVCLVCLVRMHAHSAGISSWVCHLQLGYGMTIILERLCISPTEAIHQGDKPYMQQILDPKSQTITRISILDLPSRFVHLLVISPLLDICIKWSTTTVKQSMNMMCISCRSVLVATSLFLMVTFYQQESLFLVANQLTIYSCSNGTFLGRWDVVNIRPAWHLEICRTYER